MFGIINLKQYARNFFLVLNSMNLNLILVIFLEIYNLKLTEDHCTNYILVC